MKHLKCEFGALNAFWRHCGYFGMIEHAKIKIFNNTRNADAIRARGDICNWMKTAGAGDTAADCSKVYAGRYGFPLTVIYNTKNLQERRMQQPGVLNWYRQGYQSINLNVFEKSIKNP